MEKNKKNCGWCETPLKGRLDKRFCNDDCRSKFHNHRVSGEYHAMNVVNHALSKNRRILSTLLPVNKSSLIVSRENLLVNGFQFRYFTEIQTGEEGRTYHYCYEYGYLSLSEDQFKLIRNPYPHSGR